MFVEMQIPRLQHWSCYKEFQDLWPGELGMCGLVEREDMTGPRGSNLKDLSLHLAQTSPGKSNGKKAHGGSSTVSLGKVS